ncbi:hypothetical protein EVAR_98841_1 [Eumeta japonica]|uniref:Uncharacterized protein n=1 Tax=Eumeta variegata TaxID=151549 RepID=A0A4C1YIL7_EUMVA|nr:hypothetical protein EVAR_98841_1 [Eumeta japonica]
MLRSDHENTKNDDKRQCRSRHSCGNVFINMSTQPLIRRPPADDGREQRARPTCTEELGYRGRGPAVGVSDLGRREHGFGLRRLSVIYHNVPVPIGSASNQLFNTPLLEVSRARSDNHIHIVAQQGAADGRPMR